MQVRDVSDNDLVFHAVAFSLDELMVSVVKEAVEDGGGQR
jgi:hypothetical protein